MSKKEILVRNIREARLRYNALATQVMTLEITEKITKSEIKDVTKKLKGLDPLTTDHADLSASIYVAKQQIKQSGELRSLLSRKMAKLAEQVKHLENELGEPVIAVG